MVNKFNNVGDVAAYLADDPEVKKDVECEIEQSSIITALVQIRLQKGISQKKVAKTLGCDPSKISKLEAGNDSQLRIADIEGYLRALGVSMSLLFHDEGLPAAQRIKQHVFAIHDLLEKLAAIAKQECDDQQMVEKIHLFYGEVLFNFLTRFGSSFEEVKSLMTLGEESTEEAKGFGNEDNRSNSDEQKLSDLDHASTE